MQQQLEFAILNMIAGWHTPLLDRVLPIISSFGHAGIGWAVLAFLLFCFPKTRRAGLTMGLALVFCLLLGTMLLKPLVARPRPFTYFPDLLLLVTPPSDFSFPSGHTFAGFSASTALYLYHRKAGVLAYLLAITIAFSRLYLYVHFPTDILAGIILGLANGWVSYKIMQKLTGGSYRPKH